MRRMMVMLSAVVLFPAFLTGCPEGPAFILQVSPAEITDSIPDQRCVFLVSVTQAPDALLLGRVHIAAAAAGAEVVVDHADIRPGELAEVTIIPSPLDDAKDFFDGRDIGVTMQGEHWGTTVEKTANVHVTSEETDLVYPWALEVRDMFIPWLAEHHPELGIDENTEWIRTIVTPHILVVTHYLYFSEEWEMHVFWHVMIPPYDWARIELRHRFDETLPSLAYEISSRSAEPAQSPEPIEPSDTLWR